MNNRFTDGSPTAADVFMDFEFTSDNCPGWTQAQIDAANNRNVGVFPEEQEKESQ